ncbi:MAG: aminotransferase class I/II-fold pyridoxal phosphate-dependent enzyme [Ruminococcaceae bacterium]|nr:aminotransferase class I/II-fold pyridoxal phosphate-dependent enzyme [Oscillospiraceae bacterium]
MNTPIFDFVKSYNEQNQSRFHMPGHKGVSFLGCEPLDITEIDGADVLYSANGIINESQKNASALFGTAKTLYSTEGSSLCIRAMLSAVAAKYKNPLVLAARNIHKSFINACALSDVEVEFIYSPNSEHLCSCNIGADDIENAIKSAPRPVNVVYLTSPDYLGNISDISAISKVCRKYGVLLLVDNAHGAYLNFLNKSTHPIHLGADICCDSAHKTLPVLTGGAYLHIGQSCDSEFATLCEKMLLVHASSSPSYLILQSLDLCNEYLAENYNNLLNSCIEKINNAKAHLIKNGFCIKDSEPLKIVIDALSSGYTGDRLARLLIDNKIIPEYYDDEFVVLMASPNNTDADFERLTSVLSKSNAPIKIDDGISVQRHERVLSLREAVFSKSETVSVESALNRICAAPTVSCPPAIPIVLSGERINENDIALMQKYGIKNIDVVK